MASVGQIKVPTRSLQLQIKNRTNTDHVFRIDSASKPSTRSTLPFLQAHEAYLRLDGSASRCVDLGGAFCRYLRCFAPVLQKISLMRLDREDFFDQGSPVHDDLPAPAALDADQFAFEPDLLESVSLVLLTCVVEGVGQFLRASLENFVTFANGFVLIANSFVSLSDNPFLLADCLVSLIDLPSFFSKDPLTVIDLILTLLLLSVVLLPKGIGRVDQEAFVTFQLGRDVRRQCQIVERRPIVGIRECEIRRPPFHEDLRRRPIIFGVVRPDVGRWEGSLPEVSRVPELPVQQVPELFERELSFLNPFRRSARRY